MWQLRDIWTLTLLESCTPARQHVLHVSENIVKNQNSDAGAEPVLSCLKKSKRNIAERASKSRRGERGR